MEDRDDWGDPRDDDPVGAYPPAPAPPHERLWRHPSELAATTIREIPVASALGRGFMVTTSIVVVVFAIGMVRLLGSGGTNAPAPLAGGDPDRAPSGAVVTTVGLTAITTVAAVVTTRPGGPGSTVAVAPAELLPPVTLSLAGDAAAIVWDDGTWAVTASGDVAAGEQIELTLPDGEVLTGRVVRVDGAVAVLSIDDMGSDMPPAPPLGTLPGDAVAVSAVARDGQTVEATLIRDEHGLTVELPAGADLAPGAPLSNAAGEVVALCGGRHDGSLSAIDVGTVSEVMEDVPVGWLGVAGRWHASGVEVTDVRPGSPATTIGLEISDVITSLDGEAIDDIGQFARAIRRSEPGSVVTLEIDRGGDVITVEVEIAGRA